LISSTTTKIWRPKTEGEVCCCTNFQWGSNCPSCFGTGFAGGYDCVGVAILEESFSSYYIRALFQIKVADLFAYNNSVHQVRTVRQMMFSDSFEIKTENLNLIFYQIGKLVDLLK